MTRYAQLAVIALLAAGLATAGCDDPEIDEDPVEQEVDEPAVEDEDDTEEHEEAELDEPDIDEDMYVRAAYEVRCVDEQIEDDDEASEIRDEIYARYGFTEESFQEADDEMEGEESAQVQISARMEECDEEIARGFADEGGDEVDEEMDEEEEEADESDDEAEDDGGEEEAAAAEPAPEPTPEPAMTGTLNAGISGSDFEETNLRLQIRSDFDISGQLRGEREGNSFMIPISGEVSEGNSITASGDRGGNNVEIDGRLSESGAEGRLTGEVNQRSFRLQYSAE